MFSQDQNVGKAPSSSSLDRFRNVDMTLNATRSTSGFVLINEEVDVSTVHLFHYSRVPPRVQSSLVPSQLISYPSFNLLHFTSLSNLSLIKFVLVMGLVLVC